MTKLIYKILLLLLFLVLLTGCESNRYRRSTSSYYEGNYTVAIEEIDTYLSESKNGAYKTNAELIRSKSYHQLALKAYNSSNLALATRFAILANSTATDTLLARCYYDYAKSYLAKNEKAKGFEFYNQILLEIPNSRFTPEIIYTKMADSYSNTPENYSDVWELYKQLYPDYKDDYYEKEAQKIVGEFSAKYISDALAETHQEGLKKLKDFISYPIGNTKEAKGAVAQIYINMAEKNITNDNFIEADNNFKAAVFYNPSVKEFVKKRLLDTAEQYIVKGQKYVDQRDFENAFILFNRTFDVIPGYKKALNAIQETTELLNRIEQAKSLFDEGLKLEKANLRNIFPGVKVKLSVTERNNYEIQRFEKILALYQKAYQLDALSQYKQQIFYTQNIIKYYKNPDEFAIKILKEHKYFIVEQAISQARNYLITNNPSDVLTDTGWEVLVASGSYQYEVRYSLISHTEKFYFRWLVNLRTKEITALNSLSEQAMQGKFVIDEEE
jgi:hypothetical protein